MKPERPWIINKNMATEIEFNADLLTALGGNLVDVELLAADYSFAFRQAKKVFQQKGNNNSIHDYFGINVVAGTTIYNIDSTINIVTRILRPSATLYPNNPFDAAYIQNIFGASRGNEYSSSFATFQLTSNLLEDIERFSANAVQFDHDRLNSRIKLIGTPTTDGTWIMECFSNATDDQYRDKLWIFDWTLAELKIILGKAYSKFQVISTPAGDSSLDGEALIQEGKDDKERLLEDIKNFVDDEPTGLPMIMG